MEPARHDLIIYRDRDFSQAFIFKDDDGVIINLTGYAAKAQVRPTKNSSTLIVEFTTAIVAAQGRITMTLTDAQALAISESYSKGWWDLVLTDPSNLRQS